MLTVNKLIPQGQGLAPVLLKRAATVELDWDVRQKSRFDATDNQGRHLGVFLPRGTVVRGGDVLVTESGDMVRVLAAPQPVLVITPCTEHGSPFDLVRAGEVDFALTAADPQQADLHYDPMMSDRFVLLIPSEHPLAHGKGPVRWADTVDAGHVSMTHPSSVRQYAEWAFLQNRIRFQPVFEAEHLATIAAMVECGFGVAALPEIAAGTVRQAGIVERLLTAPVTERSIGLVTARNRSLSPAAVALVGVLRAHLAQAGGGVADPA